MVASFPPPYLITSSMKYSGGAINYWWWEWPGNEATCMAVHQSSTTQIGSRAGMF